jgi:hypothetical protein
MGGMKVVSSRSASKEVPVILLTRLNVLFKIFFLHLEPLHQPFSVMSFFEIGSYELFAWAGFEL